MARTVGGFKPHPKKQNDPKNSTKSKFNPKYNPINNPTGTVSNSNAHLGSGNTPIFHDEERDGDNIQSVLGFDNDRIFTDEERGTNPELTPESVMAGAAGGALVGAALDSTPGHEGVDTPEDGETTVDTNDTSNVEPGEIQNEVTSEATVQSDGSVEVTQTVETTGTGDLSGIDEITAAPETTVIMNEDGSVGLETDSHLELSGDDGDTDLRLRDKLSDDSSDVDPIVR